MPLPREPFSEWGAPQLKELLADPPAEESARLDFKREQNLLRAKGPALDKAQKDLLKDIAAMANAGGGAILIGVNEKRRKNAPPVADELVGIPKDDVEPLRKKIWSLVDQHLVVRPPRPLIWPVPLPDEPDKRVVIVEVQQNTYSLSMVTLGGLNQFWHRRTWDNKPMTTDEIQHAFDQMARLRRSAEVELRRIERRMAENVDHPAAWIAIVPIKRARDHIPTDPARLQAAMEKRPHWRRLFGDSSAARCYLSGHFEAFARGMRLSVPGFGILAEVHRDGTVIHRSDVSERQSGKEGGETIVHLHHIYRTWLGGLCLFRDLGEYFGFPPVAAAAVGCMNFNGRKLRWLDLQGDPYTLPENSLTLDPILLSESYEPQAVLRIWAGELANWWGKTQPIPCRPWLGDAHAPDLWDFIP